MDVSTRHKYLEHEVLSAAPQKLQLLLLDGAIRSGQLAKQRWHDDWEAAGESIVRGQEIVAQLLAGLQPDRRPPLVRKVAAVYTFVFRSLAVAHLQRHEKSLDDALRVLEVERETWRQVCQQLGNQRSLNSPAAPHFDMATTDADSEIQPGVSFEV